MTVQRVRMPPSGARSLRTVRIGIVRCQRRQPTTSPTKLESASPSVNRTRTRACACAPQCRTMSQMNTTGKTSRYIDWGIPWWSPEPSWYRSALRAELLG